MFRFRGGNGGWQIGGLRCAFNDGHTGRRRGLTDGFSNGHGGRGWRRDDCGNWTCYGWTGFLGPGRRLVAATNG